LIERLGQAFDSNYQFGRAAGLTTVVQLTFSLTKMVQDVSSMETIQYASPAL